jgi:uncharacterized protein (DUF433 family)
MSVEILPELVPLQLSSDGVIRVGHTRVTLDTVITVFKQGLTAEEIVYRYPSLRLADVYGTIAYYLNHQNQVEEYLDNRKVLATEIRHQNEARFDPQGLRDRLIARQVERSLC